MPVHIKLSPTIYSAREPLSESELSRLSQYANRWLDRVVLQWLAADEATRQQLEELTSIIHEGLPHESPYSG